MLTPAFPLTALKPVSAVKAKTKGRILEGEDEKYDHDKDKHSRIPPDLTKAWISN
jgi:hypothetical protein